MCWNPGKLLSSAFSILGAEIQGPTAEEKNFCDQESSREKKKSFFSVYRLFISLLYKNVMGGDFVNRELF